MSKAKSNNAVVVVTVSVEQFNSAVTDIIRLGSEAKEAFTMAACYIAQATNKKDQDALKKQLAIAYAKFTLEVDKKTIEPASAVRWVHRRVIALAPKGFKWIESNTANAIQKRKARQTKGGKAEVITPVPAPKILTSIEMLRKALITKEKAIADEYRGVIPAGKIKDFDSAFAAFIQTIELILV